VTLGDVGPIEFTLGCQETAPVDADTVNEEDPSTAEPVGPSTFSVPVITLYTELFDHIVTDADLDALHTLTGTLRTMSAAAGQDITTWAQIMGER